VVTKHIEADFMLFDQRSADVRRLRRDRADRRAQFPQRTRHLLQSIQLCIAIGSPGAAKECQHQRSLRQEIAGAHVLTVGVRQREARQLIADLDQPVHDARHAQVFGGRCMTAALSAGMRFAEASLIPRNVSSSAITCSPWLFGFRTKRPPRTARARHRCGHAVCLPTDQPFLARNLLPASMGEASRSVAIVSLKRLRKPNSEITATMSTIWASV